jgi:hypothetical protein
MQMMPKISWLQRVNSVARAVAADPAAIAIESLPSFYVLDVLLRGGRRYIACPHKPINRHSPDELQDNVNDSKWRNLQEAIGGLRSTSGVATILA